MGAMSRSTIFEIGVAVLTLIAEIAIVGTRGDYLELIATALMCAGGVASLSTRWPTVLLTAGLAVATLVEPPNVALSAYAPLAPVVFRLREGRTKPAVIVTMVGLSLAIWQSRRATGATQWLSTVLTWVVLYALAWLVGRAMWVTQERLKTAHQLDLAAQRHRIAAELHDNLAHEVTMMVLRAETARQHPATAVVELEMIAQSGRRANAQLRRMMRLLQVEERMRPLPLPQALASIRQDLANIGFDVNLTVDGNLGDIDEVVGDCLARVLKEATNNVQRHGDRESHCAIFIDVGEGRVQLAVRNRMAHPYRPHGTGLGLEGMAQRVEGIGGNFWAGRQGSMWLVRANLPLSGRL